MPATGRPHAATVVLVAIVIVLLNLVVDVAAARRCGETVEPGTREHAVCNLMMEEGQIAVLVLPASIILALGFAGSSRKLFSAAATAMSLLAMALIGLFLFVRW